MVKLRRPIRDGVLEAAEADLRTQFSRIGAGEFSGFVYDRSDPNKRFAVELWLDGMPVRLSRADGYVAALASEGFGDACYGFSFSLSAQILNDSLLAEARLANSHEPVGQPVFLDAAVEEASDSRGHGGVEWLGGLRFQGWAQCVPAESPLVHAVVDGQTVAEARASGFGHIGDIDNTKLVKTFDLHLPRDYADGRARRVHFVTENGVRLTMAPVTFVAFPDSVEEFFAGFAEIASERLRGRQLDRLLPASVPFTSYQAWRARWDAPSTTETARSMAVLLIGGGDDKVSLQSLDQQTHERWIGAVLPAVDGAGSFDCRELGEFLASDAGDADTIIFAVAGLAFADDALTRIEEAFEAFPQARIVYGDVEMDDQDGRHYPLAWPAFDYERMLEQGYCAHLFAMTREAAESALARNPTNLYRLFNSQFDSEGPAAASGTVHTPFVLGRLPPIDVTVHSRLLSHASQAHLSARRINADVTVQRGAGLPAARVVRRTNPASLTIIIPVRNRKALLQTCLSSITPALKAARANILIVDNDSTDADMMAYLDTLRRGGSQVLSVPGPFNFARLNNLAVAACQTDEVLLLNNDIRAIDAGWLEEMRSRLDEPDVGAVGALLLWPSGMVQHGGVVLGPSFAATHVGNDRLANDPGYAEMLRTARECSAVTAACLLTRRSDYLAIGGMDEVRFPVNFNDVDYCLKLRNLGKRIVWTPQARLYHHESASRGLDRAGDKAMRFERELRNLRNKWGDALIDDPYYNPVLSLDPVPFSALAWPPRRRAPRLNLPPRPVNLPPGF